MGCDIPVHIARMKKLEVIFEAETGSYQSTGNEGNQIEKIKRPEILCQGVVVGFFEGY